MKHDDPDLVDAYAACDVFVLPSLHEPFGIVVLEAWSARKPVIVSRVGGLQALVTDEHTGLFSDSTLSLSASLLRLHRDGALRETLAQNGQAKGRESYDWSRIHNQLENLYERAEERAAQRYGLPRGMIPGFTPSLREGP
jgi:glycosyltransferase involved in cell wall biosynthesis